MMNTFSKLNDYLNANGYENQELPCMVDSFKEADDFEGIEYYQNQLFGFACGLATAGIIKWDDVNTLMNNLEQGEM